MFVLFSVYSVLLSYVFAVSVGGFSLQELAWTCCVMVAIFAHIKWFTARPKASCRGVSLLALDSFSMTDVVNQMTEIMANVWKLQVSKPLELEVDYCVCHIPSMCICCISYKYRISQVINGVWFYIGQLVALQFLRQLVRGCIGVVALRCCCARGSIVWKTHSLLRR